MRKLMDTLAALIPAALVAWPVYHWYSTNWNFRLEWIELGYLAMAIVGVLGLYAKFIQG